MNIFEPGDRVLVQVWSPIVDEDKRDQDAQNMISIFEHTFPGVWFEVVSVHGASEDYRVLAVMRQPKTCVCGD